MKHRTLPRFWRHYRQLPKEIQRLADKNFQLLKADPHHPSLHLKRIGKTKQLWSVRVGLRYRALGVEKPDGIVWFWIGTHADYDKRLS
jgi:mRNA-degrading endonuclease RelE of RelBE toxin-antitoxin system